MTAALSPALTPIVTARTRQLQRRSASAFKTRTHPPRYIRVHTSSLRSGSTTGGKSMTLLQAHQPARFSALAGCHIVGGGPAGAFDDLVGLAGTGLAPLSSVRFIDEP